MDNITEEDIIKAYRYLKNFLYYDKTALFARYKLAEFEYKIRSKDKLNEPLKILEIFNGDKKAITEKLNKIKVKVIPKTVVDSTKRDKDSDNNDSEYKNEDEIRFFTNDISNQKIKIEKYNYLIDAPIEIYIISVLWLMKVAPKFSNNISNDNYAYQFRIEKEKNKTDNYDKPYGISLYQPYFCGYQKWRDNALSKVNELVSSGNDATLIGLDIQRYFYNIQLDLNKLLNEESKHENLEKGEDYARLTELLCKIHKRYTQKVLEVIPKTESNDEISNEYKQNSNITMLPLGLPSSGFIANLYLADFDRKVHEKLNPDYYGRYVDDILIVLKNCKCENVYDFINSKLREKKILEPALKEENKEGKTQINNYYLIDHKNLKIQKKKVIVQHLNHNGSKAVINSFMRKIRENSSEFNRLPDEDDVFSDFEDEAFELEQDGSHNKLRDIKTFKSNKFGASKFLSKRILFANILPDKEGKSKKESSQIIQFFKGTTGIDNYTLWPKVATYFIVKNDQQALYIFYKSIKNIIDKIEPNDKEGVYEDIKSNLQFYLKLSIATPLALNPEFVSKNEISGKTKNDIEFIRDQALKFRKSNMFQHDLIAYSLFNYTEEFEQEFKKTEECDSTFTNLLSASKILSKISDKEPKFSERMMNFSPRVVKLHEVCNFYEYSFGKNKKEDLANLEDSANENKMDVIVESFIEFLKCSYLSDSISDSFSIKPLDKDNPLNRNKEIIYISIKDNDRDKSKPTRLRVAVSNTKISEDTIKNHRMGKAEYCEKDIRNIFKIVNEAISNKADLLVLPEWCMPYRLFNIIANKCIKNDMALITGMKYTFDKDNYAYNKVATILPLKIHSFSNAFITFRQKNHLAPKEDLALQAYGYSKPLKTNDVYYHYQWHNAYFAVYNCFELADIVDRSIFKSEIDFVVATELNKDIHYYSDIVGATVRDLHCYFIQANCSKWGDSRITEPSKHDTRDLVRVKGGINPSVLIEDIDLSKLREFQIQEYVGQEANKDFKFTPPNFDKKNVKKRIDDEPIIKD